MSSLRAAGDIESGFSFINAAPARRGLAWLATSACLLLLVVLNAYIFVPDFPFCIVLLLLCLAMYIGRYASFQVDNDLRNRGGVTAYMQRLQIVGLAIIHRNLDHIDLDNTYPPVLREEDINALPLQRYRVRSNEQGNGSMQSDDMELTCCICLEDVKGEELLRTLPCRHQFHPSCITPWLQKKGTCPLCKYMIIPGQEGSGSGTSGA